MGNDQDYLQRESRHHRKSIVILSDQLHGEKQKQLGTTYDKVGKNKGKRISTTDKKSSNNCSKHKHAQTRAKRVEENDYLLEAINNLKQWIKETWKSAACLTQYCYPGFRTLEFYKKIRHQQKCECTGQIKKARRSRESSVIKRNKRHVSGEQKAITGLLYDNIKKASNHNSRFIMADETLKDIGGVFVDSSSAIPKAQDVHLVLEPPTYVPSIDTVPGYSEQIDPISDGGWLSLLKNYLHGFSSFLNDDGDVDGLFSSVFFKWACLLSLPAVFLLRTHYLFLRRKYENLSDELKKAQTENQQLSSECGILERAFSSRLLTMPSPSRDTLKRINSDLKVLSENTIKLKNELNQSSSSKVQLIKELENADVFLTNLKKKYTSITKRKK